MILDRRFIIGSFFLHAFVLIVLVTISDWHGSRQSFLVLGAHSRIPTHAYFSLPKPKPVVRQKIQTCRTPAQPAKKTPLKKMAPVKKVQAQKPAPQKPPAQKTSAPQKTQSHQATQKNVQPAVAENNVPSHLVAIQDAVDKVWRPPVGVAKGTECSLSVKLDAAGRVMDFELVKKSPVWIFNSSVLQAARQLMFGREFGGMSFVINFKQ